MAIFPLHVSDDARFLLQGDGSAFFYLGDTAWELFHRLSRDEADFYLQTRAAQGFTVIQAVALAEFGGLHVPNPNGDAPFFDFDPTRPNEAFWQHVDWIVERAGELGLVVGFLPTWGDKWNRRSTDALSGPEVFTPENARIYAEWLGWRYQNAPIIWILGGDRPVETQWHRAVIEAMALGLQNGDGGRHLTTFHPPGGHSSSDYFPAAAWLDFHSLQSGHCGRNQPNDEMLSRDYALAPPKPCLDSEPRYEDHPIMSRDWSFDGRAWFGDSDVRRALYCGLLAGACGHTYGAHSVWQMWDASREAINHARTPYKTALSLPGAGQMRHARTLLEGSGLNWLDLVPDQTLIASDAGEGVGRVRAARDQNRAWALIYVPRGESVTVEMSKLNLKTGRATWFDPRGGNFLDAGPIFAEKAIPFALPLEWGGPDWILVLRAD